MKKIISIAVIGIALAALVVIINKMGILQSGPDCVDAQNSAIVAAKISGDINDIALTTEAWDKAQCTSVTLYPQKTVKTNDKTVNDLMADAKGIKANVKALYNDDKIALMLSWEDSEASHQGMTSDKFSDGFAVQFAQDSSDASKLPYIGMGSVDRPVVIYLQKTTAATFEPNGNGEHKPQRADQSMNKFGEDLAAYHKEVAALAETDYQKAFIAEGFRSTTELRDAKTSFNAGMKHADNRWTATLVRSIKDAELDLSSGEFPIALAVWDGKKANRDGQKWLSGWVAVELGKKDGVLLKGITEMAKGDVAKGKALAAENCAACHIFDDQNNGMPFMAPNLSEIGGQATVAYIKESMKDPSAVVVPGYNRNAHPNYKWYELADGKRISTMPSYDWLSEEQVNDIVAYFKTLK